MDLPAITGPFASHGTAPGQHGNVVEMWDQAYRKYRALGMSEEIAARLANMEVSSNAQSYLERSDPNAIEKWNEARLAMSQAPDHHVAQFVEIFFEEEEERISLIMSIFPGSPRILKGDIVLLDPLNGAVLRVTPLRYNPDTLSN